MTELEGPATRDDLLQLRMRVREAILSAAAPLRPVSGRLYAKAMELGWDETAADLSRVKELMDGLERRIDAILASAAAGIALDEDRDRLLRRVRHDLRNPIGAMAGYLELSVEEAEERGNKGLAAEFQAFHSEILALVTFIDSIGGGE